MLLGFRALRIERRGPEAPLGSRIRDDRPADGERAPSDDDAGQPDFPGPEPRRVQGHDVWRRVAAAACGGRAGPATRCWRTPLKAPRPTRGITGQGRAASPLHVPAAWALCGQPAGAGIEPMACAM